MINPAWRAGYKWGWIVLVVGFVGFYACTRQKLILESLSMLDGTVLLAALVAIMIAKLTLVENMRLAAQRAGLSLPYSDCYCIYNLTQLAKYVPGSIWQFVSRIAMLRERGASTANIRDSMLAEQSWVLMTASLFGLVFMLSSEPTKRAGELARILPGGKWLWLVLVVAGLIGLAILFHPAGRRLLRWSWSLRPSLRAILTLLVSWFCFGSAFWITLLPFSHPPVPWLYGIGIYCLAYFTGFVVPFAPAGLGIREAVLVASVSSYVGVEIAVVMAGVNRVLYLIAEIIISFPCLRKMTRH